MATREFSLAFSQTGWEDKARSMTQLKWVPVGHTVWSSPLRAAWQGHRATVASERPGRLPASIWHARTCAAAAGWHRLCAQRPVRVRAHACDGCRCRCSCCVCIMHASCCRQASALAQAQCMPTKIGRVATRRPPADEPRPGCMRCVVCTVTGRAAAAPNWPANSSYIGQSLAAPFLSERVFGLDDARGPVCPRQWSEWFARGARARALYLSAAPPVVPRHGELDTWEEQAGAELADQSVFTAVWRSVKRASYWALSAVWTEVLFAPPSAPAGRSSSFVVMHSEHLRQQSMHI